MLVASVKKAKFIQAAVETIEMFRRAAPADILKAIMIHCTSFHGSSLWDLEGGKSHADVQGLEHLPEGSVVLPDIDKNILGAASRML